MADATYSQQVSFGAGNGSRSVLYYGIDLGLSDVQRIILTFPAGCAGLVGMQIQYSENSVYPSADDQYYVFDDYVYVIEVSNQRKFGQWRLAGYNMDYIPHSIQIVIEYNYVTYSPNVNTTPAISM